MKKCMIKCFQIIEKKLQGITKNFQIYNTSEKICVWKSCEQEKCYVD